MKKTISFLLCTLMLYACGENNQTATTDDQTSVMDTTNGKMASTRGYEFGDDKYTEIAKKSLQSLASGDVDAFGSNFADNAIFRWSGGDSLSGKPAISEYWRKRRSETIGSLSFANDVWLSINVSTPMAETQLPGNYALCWNMVTATYKTGKSMTQRMHMVYHFDNNDKIDRVTQYLDRVPISKAEAK